MALKWSNLAFQEPMVRPAPPARGPRCRRRRPARFGASDGSRRTPRHHRPRPAAAWRGCQRRPAGARPATVPRARSRPPGSGRCAPGPRQGVSRNPLDGSAGTVGRALCSPPLGTAPAAFPCGGSAGGRPAPQGRGIEKAGLAPGGGVLLHRCSRAGAAPASPGDPSGSPLFQGSSGGRSPERTRSLNQPGLRPAGARPAASGRAP